MTFTSNTSRGTHDLIQQVHNKLFNETVAGEICGGTVTTETALMESILMKGLEAEGALEAGGEWHRISDTRVLSGMKDFSAAICGKGGESC